MMNDIWKQTCHVASWIIQVTTIPYVNNDDFIEQFFLQILFTNLQIFYDVVKGQVFLSGYSVCVCVRSWKTGFETDMFVFVQYSLF